MSNSTQANNNFLYDIIIVGGGMVGASMALAAAKDNFRVALIEAYPLDNEAQPSFDERTIALTYSSYQIYQSLGIWPTVAKNACAIKSIEVTNTNHWGFTHLDCQEVDTQALGYVIATRDLGKALYDHIENNQYIDVFSPAHAIALHDDNHEQSDITIEIHEQEQKISQRLSGKCTVIADGGRSPLLKQLNLQNEPTQYDQKALVTIVRAASSHEHKAFEHFMSDGPLALLPYREHDYALVWTAKEHELQSLLQLNDADFLALLSQQLKGRIPTLTSVGTRHSYPLSIGNIAKATNERLVIIGNAAHIVHPVAGQGFNLGLRDVAQLADIFQRFANDPGHSQALEEYQQSRKRDTKQVSLFTDGLIKTFSSKKMTVQVARNVGLSLINLLPPVKRNLLKRTMGIHQPNSRLLKNLK